MPPLIYHENHPIKRYTTLKIGGSARHFFLVHTLTQLQQALTFAHTKHLPFVILGNGSNTLIQDGVYPGVFIVNKIRGFVHQGPRFSCGGGTSFAKLGKASTSLGFQGLEFASGIPGTVGGAIWMNAGAMGLNTSQTLQSLTFVHANGLIETIDASQLDFGYRFCSLQTLPGGIAHATFLLQKDLEAKKREEAFLSKRLESQPYGKKSCGSVFKNPPQGHAAALIDSLGLKNTRCGDAIISNQHANFFLNLANASFQDYQALIEYTQQRVSQAYGIHLNTEVQFIEYV